MTSSSTALSEQDTASFGPRDMKAPGTPAWCWQTVSALQTMWKGLDLNLDMYMETWAEAEEHRVWEKIPYESPYGSKEAMLADLELGDDARARARVASQAVAMPPLNRNGGLRKKGQPDMYQAAKYGKCAEYLTRRIARDHPNIHERMIKGEFSSVAAAAREAGIYPDRPRVKRVNVNNNVEKLAKSIRNILGPDDFGRFVDFAVCLSADDKEAGKAESADTTTYAVDDRTEILSGSLWEGDVGERGH